jgi:hypothetical protein
MSDSDAPLRPQYAWKRFWCPRNGTLHLIDRGYLPDPSGPYGRLLGSDLRPFEDISDLPCLVLLGEPGIGKTTALRAEREKVEAAGDETLQRRP